jgi:hypothetical protein
MCTDQGGAEGAKGTEANNYNAVWGAWSKAGNFVESAALPEITGRYKPLNHYICCAGLAADRCVL